MKMCTLITPICYIAQLLFVYMTHMKFRAKPGNFISLSYIGQSDLHITYYELLCVWYTPGRQQV